MMNGCCRLMWVVGPMFAFAGHSISVCCCCLSYMAGQQHCETQGVTWPGLNVLDTFPTL